MCAGTLHSVSCFPWLWTLLVCHIWLSIGWFSLWFLMASIELDKSIYYPSYVLCFIAVISALWMNNSSGGVCKDSNLAYITFCVFDPSAKVSLLLLCFHLCCRKCCFHSLSFLVFFPFLTGVEEECIYELCVGLARDNTIPTEPPISKQQSPTRKKQEAINQRALSETLLLLK